MRRALLGVALTGSIALVGTVITLTETSSPPAPAAKPLMKSSKPQAAALQTSAARASAPVAATALATAVSALTSADGGDVSVAVENLGTGVAASYNVSDKYVTASIVKLDILCTLLYQAQLSGHAPSRSEVSLTTTMIENSNNDAAQHLFEDVGGAPAITAANKVFGLTDTAVEEGSVDEAGILLGRHDDDRARPAPAVAAGIHDRAPHAGRVEPRLRQEPDGEMSNRTSGGESARRRTIPSPSGSDYLLKNGWLPRRTTNLWEINSVGEVQHDGQQYLVAVLSSGNKTMDSGISVVQKLAQTAVDASS
jgi:hypothetical protein